MTLLFVILVLIRDTPPDGGPPPALIEAVVPAILGAAGQTHGGAVGEHPRPLPRPTIA